MGVVDSRARPRMEERRTVVCSHDSACEDRTGCDHPGPGRRGEAQVSSRLWPRPELTKPVETPTLTLCAGRHEQINKLFQRMLYVEENEATSHITLVHFYGDHAMSPAGLPSDMDKPVVGSERTELPVLLDEERINHTDIGAVGRPAELDAIPSELEANAMSERGQEFTRSLVFFLSLTRLNPSAVLDEAFPSITVVCVQPSEGFRLLPFCVLQAS